MPTEVKVTESGQLSVAWNDGHESTYSFRSLREKCPCILCHTSREQGIPIRASEDIRPLGIGRVGLYAITFQWSDGHHTGIYTFDLLREICECDLCTAGRQAG